MSVYNLYDTPPDFMWYCLYIGGALGDWQVTVPHGITWEVLRDLRTNRRSPGS